MTQIEAALSEASNLPSMPSVASELLAISEWENVDLRDVAGIVVKDVSLTSKILRVVNSPFYSFPQQIGTVSQALVLLGLRATRALTLSFSLLAMSPRKRTKAFDYAGFWTRSLNTATVARELAVVTGFHNEEEVFVGGLLQDIGVMAMAHCAPGLYAPVLAECRNCCAPTVELERRHLGTDHVQVAKILFEKWNLPASLFVQILYHHAPEDAEKGDERVRLAIGIQHVASLLGAWLYDEGSTSCSVDEIRQAASKWLNVSEKTLTEVMQRADEMLSQNAALFEAGAQRPHSYAEMLQQANLELGSMASEHEVLMKKLEIANEESQRLAAELRSANNKLLDEARSDPLTGLGNRRMLERFLEGEIDRCVRYKHHFALLFIDIDNFKTVNDSHGHLMGDAVLKHVAAVLKHSLRVSDVVARYGGEEFVAVLVETDEKRAVISAERVRSAVANNPFQALPRVGPLPLSVSIGLAAWQPEDPAPSLHDLISHADKAMYAAKKAGRNCVRKWRRHARGKL